MRHLICGIVIGFSFGYVLVTQAQDPAPLIFSSPSVTVVHPTPYSDFYTDYQGTSATVIQVAPNMSWYSQQDKSGHITQGYLFDPLPRDKPLEVETLPKDYGERFFNTYQAP